MERFSIRLHGLGGQGLKSMIQDMLAPIILKSGFDVQAFPFFGGERRGALVSGYFRCGQKKITTHSFITNPDMVVIFDHNKISASKSAEGLKSGGTMLINTPHPNQFLGLTHNWNVYSIDARSVSLAHGIGSPEDPYMIINSVMTGAVLKLLEPIIGSAFPDDIIEIALKNALSQKIPENCAALSNGKKMVAKVMADASPMWQWLENKRAVPHMVQPDEHCTKCNLCYLLCPKRAIEIAPNGTYIIHEEKCNYCSICISLCPRDAIKIVTEEGDEKNERQTASRKNSPYWK